MDMGNDTMFSERIRHISPFLVMEIMEKATRTIATHFISHAKEGNLDDYNRISPSKIIKPKPGLLIPKGCG